MSRIIRVESLLKQEISTIIQKDFRSNLGLVSITGVKVAKDLANATVYFSHFGIESERKKATEKLKKAAFFIKKQLGQTVRLKRIPNLIFKFDDSLERGSQLLQKINQIDV
jgi:ribosome-binding factor A